MICQWLAPAKINLFLYITGRRADGYHLLQTLFQFLDYSDVININTTIGGRIRLLNSIAEISENDNLIIRAARLLQRHCWVESDPTAPGADIYIEKVLPIGGGLGGGSSNAATILVALNNHWGCGLTHDDLMHLGMMIGADVPIFLHGHAAFAEGVGERFISAFPEEKWYLIVVPPVNIVTSHIFCHPELQRDTPRRSLDELMNIPFKNDCEPVVRKYFSTIEQHFSWFLKYAPCRLTGTGACMFAEFNTKSAAHEILLQAPLWIHGFIAKGVNISPLHQMLTMEL